MSTSFFQDVNIPLPLAAAGGRLCTAEFSAVRFSSRCVDEPHYTNSEKYIRFSGFKYPSSESEQNQPWSVNGIHLTRIQIDQNAENVNHPPRSKFLPPTP